MNPDAAAKELDMKLLGGAVLIAALAAPAFAQKTAADRLQAATEDLNAMVSASDKGIPQDLLNKAVCVVVIPNLKKGGFIVGGEYGKGFFSCRKSRGAGWSAPGSLRISGGKFGLLVGGAETDVFMLVMSKSGMQHLLSNKFQMGGEASAAAGPVGRDSSAMTDASMHAEILTYSRSRGVFGGLDLAGAAVTEDKDSNRELYGNAVTNKEILNANQTLPAEAKSFVRTLDKLSPHKQTG
jgi:SH3 domain-containing YSC84-like protein 1